MHSDHLALEGISVGLFQPMPDGVAQFLNHWGADVQICPPVDLTFAEDSQLVEFAHKVMTGEVDTVILFTAYGLQRLDVLISEVVERERFLNCLKDTDVVAGGAAVQGQLKKLGIDPILKLKSESSWQDLLQVLEQESDLQNASFAIEWTHEIHGLRAGLEARGVRVQTLDFLACERKGFEFTTPFREACYDELSIVLLTEPSQCVILRKLIFGQEGQKNRHLAKLGYFDPLVGDLLRRFGWTSFRVFENNAPESWGQQEADSIARLMDVDA